ncbi:MAG TPA: glycosyl hydrolase family 79 C-terminal domain-containing protein [Solirubrobacteraceae bacterium]|nr:glycosyl hydrolase family 79 C-terminal domain-containing protein [Solirubrobacteraceae bacterium]
MVFVRRRVVFLAAAALIALALLTRVGGGRSGSAHPSTPAGPPIKITVQSGEPGRRVPAGFVGLSLEYPAVEGYAGTDPTALDPVFLQLVRNLVPGQAPVLRIGGDSTDRAWWPTPGLARPRGVTYAITRRWLEVTRALARALRARLILGLNLEADSPRLTAAEADALVHGIGARSVRGLELGNEPDLYPTFPWYHTADGHKVPGRPPSYDMSSLIADWANFSATLPPGLLAGPSLGAPRWMRQLAQFLDAEPRLRLVTLHRYPLQSCFIPRGSPRYPTIAHLLSPASSIGLADSFAPYAAMARARGLGLRIDELNSVSCGADPSVSQTFASALWVLDTLFEMVRVGVHGVNIHTFPGAGYALFELRRVDGRWRATVAPEYYGLTLFARAAPAGSTLLDVDGAAAGDVRTWATRAAGGTLRITVVNAGARARRLSLGITGGRYGPGTLEWLTAPSVRAHNGVALGGQSFGAPTFTGRLAGRARTSSVPPANGQYAVSLPADSAALIVLTRD